MMIFRQLNPTGIHFDVRCGDWDLNEARRISRRMQAELVSPCSPPRILRTALGKPYAEGNHGPRWSCSATTGASGIAWSTGQQTGLDLEHDTGEMPTDTLLRYALTSSERIQWSLRPTSGLFIEIWARKEAALKCIGTGLHFPPNRLEVGMPAERWHPVQADHDPETPCWVRSVRIGHNVACAIACRSPAPLRRTLVGDRIQPEPEGTSVGRTTSLPMSG